MIKVDKDIFIKLYEEVDGDYTEFNKRYVAETGEDSLSVTTFYRRRSKWVSGISVKPNAYNNKVPIKDDSEDNRPIAGGTVLAPDKRRRSLGGKRFVFTSAQNNTFVHDRFFRNLQAYCIDHDAQLVVGKFRYNKSGFQNLQSGADSDLWYDSKLHPYFITESCVLEETINGTVWCGELDILPTAAMPLSGLDSYTMTACSIVPHAKVQLKSVPVLKGDPIKMMYTTGACTQRNYIQRKAGQKAEFHHVFGALVVEIDENGDDFCRQLIADSSGDFYDLTNHYVDGECVDTEATVEAINWGDMHAELLDQTVARVSFSGKDCMLDVLKPQFQFVHDLTDFRARNHHNIKNPHFLAEMHYSGSGRVLDGMVDAALLLDVLKRDFCTTVVVESNHDQAFKRWLSEADIRHDPENAEYFHRANAEVFKNIRLGNKDFHVFEWAIRSCIDDLGNIIFLGEDDSFLIGGPNGIECGMHGHRGPNGARGNPNTLRNLGRKCNSGHTHTACIIDGIYTAGISCKMDMGYNKGPSSWSQSHIVTYKNGKRSIVTIKNGKWRV